MKALILFASLLSAFCSILFFSGCATVEQTIYLGDVNVNAPISPPPTHLNVNKRVGSIIISPKFSFIKNNTIINGSTSNPYTGTFRFSNDSTYRTKTKNLQWSVSNYTIGADLDLKISKGFSIFGGINFSGNSDQNLTGGNFGIGFHNHDENPIIRFDIGLTIQEYDFNAITIVHTKTESIFGSDEYWDIYSDRAKTTNINPFGTLTINSSSDSSFLNWFVTGGYFTQNLLGFTPGTYSYPLFPFAVSYTKIDTRSDMLAGFLYFNPGITLSFWPEARFVLSVKMLDEISATSGSGIIFMPSAQIDFQL
jgi:hypothetical protein